MEIRYLAGFFDGEGCITTHTTNGNKAPIVQIGINNTFLPILELFQDRWGGSITRIKSVKRHHKQAWGWRLNGRKKCLIFLQDIEPHLWEKAEQSRVAQEMLAATGEGNTPLTLEKIEIRWHCHHKLKELKRCG